MTSVYTGDPTFRQVEMQHCLQHIRKTTYHCVTSMLLSNTSEVQFHTRLNVQNKTVTFGIRLQDNGGAGS